MGLLGEVLAIHTGTTYGELIAERVASPIGLESASAWADGIVEPDRLIEGFMLGKKTPHWRMPSLAGAGGIRLCMDDLLSTLAFIKSPPRPWRAARDLMWTEYCRDGESAIGLCWEISGTDEDPIYWHNGSTYGASSFVAIRPAKDRAVAVLQNRSELIGMMVGNDSAADAIGWALIRTDAHLAP